MMIIFACVYWVLYHTWGRQTCLTFSRSYLHALFLRHNVHA